MIAKRVHRLILVLAAITGCLDPSEFIQDASKQPVNGPKDADQTLAVDPNSASGGTSEVSAAIPSRPTSAEELMAAITESFEKLADTLAKMQDVDSAHAHIGQFKTLLKEQMGYLNQVKERPELTDKYGGHQFVPDAARRNKAILRHSSERDRIRRSPELKPILDQAFKDVNYQEWAKKHHGWTDFESRLKPN